AAADSSVAPESTPPKPPPEFVEKTPSVTVDAKAKKATVLFKTNVDATVNAIVATSGDAIGTGTFYDYFRRDVKYEPAVSKKQTYSVTSAGKSETYDLPDLSKTYYLLVNAVENETDTWQTGVTVVLLYSPAATKPDIKPSEAASSVAEGTAAFGMETLVPANLYTLVTKKDAAAPTAQQIKDAGSGYTGESFGTGTAKTNSDKEPYKGSIVVQTKDLAAGEYIVWVVAQSVDSAEAPLSEVQQFAFTVS
ncbi:MAG: hypothetical protein AB7V55_06680, partial [Oscillospiraceae bacterium]